MKVLYFTCFEVTKGSHIHRNQVIALQNNGVDYSFLFISPILILNKRGLAFNNNKFGRDDVNEVKIPMVSYPFYLYIPLLPILLFFSLPVLLWNIKKGKFEIIHCRNMLSTLTAIVLKKMCRLKIKVVCDPRSVYVEEGVIYKVYKYQGWTYRNWKKIERWCYRNSDACLGLSNPFADYLRCHQENSHFIPAIVSNTFYYDEGKRALLRKEMNITNDTFVVIYVGSIGSWHSIDAYIQMLKVIKKNLNCQLKIVLLTGNQKAIAQLRHNFSVDDILKVGIVKPDEVLDYLLISDYGLLPGADTDGYEYELLYKTMLSSKAEEYLSAGLPVLVNRRIEAVNDLIEKFQCGTVFNPENFHINIKLDRKFFSEKLRDLFCARNVVKSYNELYKKLTSDI